MTRDELIKIESLLIGLSGYYGLQLDDDVLAMYAEDLSDLDFERVVKAFRTIRRDPKIHKHNLLPIPAKIIAIVKPTVPPIDEAREAAARILESIVRYGYTNSEAARNYIGELGWQAVQMHGGWTRICETPRSENGILQAQIRDLLVSVQNRANAGVGHFAPQLPSGSRMAIEATARKEEENFENLRRLSLLKLKQLEET